MDNRNRRRFPDFLTDSAVSDAYVPVREILVKRLDTSESVRHQLIRERGVTDAIDLMFATHTRLQVVVAGWVDQAVLEIHRELQGDLRCLSNALSELDVYRADQNGGVCFYLTDLAHSEVLAAMLSFEDGTMIARQYRRSNGAARKRG